MQNDAVCVDVVKEMLWVLCSLRYLEKLVNEIVNGELDREKKIELLQECLERFEGMEKAISAFKWILEREKDDIKSG